jgi:hypothetical protein
MLEVIRGITPLGWNNGYLSWKDLGNQDRTPFFSHKDVLYRGQVPS